VLGRSKFDIQIFRRLEQKIILTCSMDLTDQMLYSLTLVIIHTDVAFPGSQSFNEICVNLFNVLLHKKPSKHCNLIIFECRPYLELLNRFRDIIGFIHASEHYCCIGIISISSCVT